MLLKFIMLRSGTNQRVSTPFLPAEAQVKHKKDQSDQNFDFEESGYFETIFFKQKKTLK